MNFKHFIADLVNSSTPVWDKLDFISEGRKQYQHEILSLYEEALEQRDEMLIYALSDVSGKDGVDSNYSHILCELLKESWHKDHENIITTLEEIKDPQTVDCIYQATMVEKDHPVEMPSPITMKAIWALGTIDTLEARSRIEELEKSRNATVAKAAKAQLNSNN